MRMKFGDSCYLLPIGWAVRISDNVVPTLRSWKLLFRAVHFALGWARLRRLTRLGLRFKNNIGVRLPGHSSLKRP